MHFTLDHVKQARANGQAEGYSRGRRFAEKEIISKLTANLEDELKRASESERKGLELALVHVQCLELF